MLRRSFLTSSAGWATACLAGGLLGGCGGGGDQATNAAAGGTAGAIDVVAAPVVTPTTAAQRINLALNLEYLAGQFHSQAAGGEDLPAALVTGAGTGGVAKGARRAALGEASVAALARDLAADKKAAIETLRNAVGSSVVAMPAIDLSPASGGGFARAWELAKLTGEPTFDPYSGDRSYLLGAMLLHYGRAAAYRSLLDAAGDGADAAPLAQVLSDAVYHEAVIDAQIADYSRSHADLGRWKDALLQGLSTIDRSAGQAPALADALDGCNDVSDGADGTIAFARSVEQLRALVFLAAGAERGGFLPRGLNVTG